MHPFIHYDSESSVEVGNFIFVAFSRHHGLLLLPPPRSTPLSCCSYQIVLHILGYFLGPVSRLSTFVRRASARNE